MFVALFLFLVLWLAPAVVAYRMGEEKGMGALGLVLGVCLGWLGVAAVYVLGGGSGEERRQSQIAAGTHFACPWCQELVRMGALVCPHCRRDIPGLAQ